MAIKRGTKIDASFSTASMSDVVFLLLVFLLIATTLINPNALKLTLPTSSRNQISDKAYTSVSITADEQYYIETDQVPIGNLEAALKTKLEWVEKPVIALHTDGRTPMQATVNVISIAKDNNYTVIMVTKPK